MVTAVAVLFFFSGLSALLYEIALVRLLTYSFGHTIYSVTVILTTFMAGLALGSHLFGRLADRRPERGLFYYALIEGGIGLYVLFLLLVWPLTRSLERWAGVTLHPSFTAFLMIKFVASFLVLVPLTTLMGGTLPLVIRYLTARRGQLGATVGALYGSNTIGGMAGTFLSGFLLIPYLGLRATLGFGFLVNAMVCAGGLLLLRAFSRAAVRAEPAEASEAPKAASGAHRAGSGGHRTPSNAPLPATLVTVVVPLVAFASGFASLGIEVVWTRVFSSLLGPTPYVFSVILLGFLGGLGTGSFLTGKFLRQPRGERLILWSSLALAASAILILLVYPILPRLAEWMNAVVGPQKAASMSWIQYDGFRFLLIFVLIYVITLILGLSLPLLMRANVLQTEHTGRSIGNVYAINTVGAIAGSAVVGFLLLPHLGSSASSVLLSAMLLAGSLALLFSLGTLKQAGGVTVLGGLAVVLAARTPTYSFTNFLGDKPTVTEISPSSKVVFNKEDPTANVCVTRTPAGKHILFVDGILTASDNEEIFWNLALKGHLPVLFHPHPEKVLIVGLGAGITLGAIAQHDVASITVVEIAKSVLAIQDLFRSGNLDAYRDPRVRLIENDGRDYLVTTREQFDVITVDQTDPPVMMLYSKDFYEDARKALRPDGIFLQWVPLYKMSDRSLLSIIRAFEEVFPSVTVWNGKGCLFLVGTNGALHIDLKTLAARLEQPKVKSSLTRFGADKPEALLGLYLMGDKELAELLRTRDSGGVATSDDRPIIEYLVPKERLFPPPKLRILMSEIPGDVRDIVAGDPAAFDQAFSGIDFKRVAKTMVLLGPEQMAQIARGTMGGPTLGLNPREFDIVRHYVLSRPLSAPALPARGVG
jgi:spermidine synthase